MDTSAGLDSGKIAKSTFGSTEVSEPDMAGDRMMRIRAERRPVHREATAPVVLNRFQYREYRMVGTFADAAIQNARDTRKATFWFIAPIPSRMDATPITTTVMRETRTCSSSVA